MSIERPVKPTDNAAAGLHPNLTKIAVPAAVPTTNCKSVGRNPCWPASSLSLCSASRRVAGSSEARKRDGRSDIEIGIELKGCSGVFDDFSVGLDDKNLGCVYARDDGCDGGLVEGREGRWSMRGSNNKRGRRVYDGSLAIAVSAHIGSFSEFTLTQQNVLQMN